MDQVIVTAAICGAEVTKDHNPHVPYTVEEIAQEAKRAHEAGAAIIHLHVREDDGTPTQSRERFASCMDAIRNVCPDVIIQPSTGGAAGMTAKERLQPIELGPEMATLDCGTLNFGRDEIFVNTPVMMIEFAQMMLEHDVRPELEVFDQSMILAAQYLIKKGYVKRPPHFNLVLGVRGGIGASMREFSFLRDSLPLDATFTASGIGRHQFSVASMAIVSGGHVRVGFEDNIYLSPGQLAQSNGDLVAKAVRLARMMDRDIASPDEARAILNLKRERS